jgi:putative tricarboxylic transport membrane protein
MRLDDSVAGLLVAGVGAAVVLAARGFPPSPGQVVGPWLFPMAVGAGLVVLGGVLAAGGLAAREGPLVVLDAWARRPRMVRNFVLVIADLLFYAVVVSSLGFFLTSAVFLLVLFLAFDVRWTRAIGLAGLVTVVMHYAFYTWLRVPLPWGVLERIAW